jgi:iron complex outermembrane receptor protein
MPLSSRGRLAFLLVTSALTSGLTSGLAIAPAAAQTAESQRSFSVPAGDASAALNAFAAQADIELLYPFDAVAGRVSPGLAGAYTVREGLVRLIADLPLTLASQNGRVYALRAAGAGGGDEATTLVDDVIVMGSRAALDRALRTERAADNLLNVVSAEDIGQFADENVAESLQRLPGVSIGRSEGEGRSVSVRGLPSQFTAVTVDGVRLGTSNNDTASVALDSVSNEQLQQIEISKSVLPSQDADTIGGAIDLKTLSAFRSREGVQIKAEGYYGEEVEDWGQEIAVNLTRKFLDDKLGLGATLSWSERPIRGTELEAEEGLDVVAALEQDDPEYLRPNEVVQVTETGQRTRWNGSVNLEYHPDAATEFYLRGTYSKLNDDDMSFQDIWVIEESEDEKILEVRPRGGLFDDVENERRLFFQDITDTITSLSAGGRVERAGWEAKYQLDWSLSKFDNPNAMRGRFRAEELLVDLDVGKDGYTLIPTVGDDGDGGDPFDPGDYQFNQLLYVQERREDEILSARLDLGRDFQAFGGAARLDFGGRLRSREKFNDREEYTGNPRSYDFRRTMDGLDLFDIEGLGYTAFFPTRQAGYDLFLEARDLLLADPAYQREDLSASGDYTVSEDVSAAYVQTTFEPRPDLRVVAGVRVEHTRSESQGYYTEFDGSGRGPDGQPNAGEIVDLGTVENSYTEWFPGVHLRWEPAADLLVRASWSRGLQRPNFNDRVNRLRVQFDSNDPDNRDLFAGNPYLEPLTADSFDLSAAWYPNEETALQAAVFHKRIDNFFFDFSGDGSDLDTLPIRLPDGVSGDFESVELTLNGEEAKVTGVELSWTQTYSGLPGLLSGVFTQANVTVTDSESTANVRDGESFALPGQRDVVGNLSLGWEDDRLSMRVAANYRGEALIELGGDPEEDVFTDPGVQVDFNLRYDVNDTVRLYLDAANVTDESEIRYYRGDDHGPMLYGNSAFGRTFKVGVRARF